MTQLTEHTETGYTWLVDTIFDNKEILVEYLDRAKASYRLNGPDLFAEMADVRAAEALFTLDRHGM